MTAYCYTNAVLLALDAAMSRYGSVTHPYTSHRSLVNVALDIATSMN